MPLDGMNTGCTATMLPAGGVLNVEVHGALELSFAASKSEPLLYGVEVIAR